MERITLDEAIEAERVWRNNQRLKRQAMAIVQKEECEAGRHDFITEYLIGAATRYTDPEKSREGARGVSLNAWRCKWCGEYEQPDLGGLDDVQYYPDEYRVKTGRIR
jgi:rubrerythrin